MNRDIFNNIYADVLLALDGVSKKHGVKFEGKGWGSGTRTSFVIKIEAAVTNPDGTAETQERVCYKTFCVNLQMKPEWLDQTFKFGGEEYQIVGLNTRRSKRPVLCKNLRNDKTYVFAHGDVNLIMRGQEAAAAVKI